MVVEQKLYSCVNLGKIDQSSSLSSKVPLTEKVSLATRPLSAFRRCRKRTQITKRLKGRSNASESS